MARYDIRLLVAAGVALTLSATAPAADWRAVAGESTLGFVASYAGADLPGRFDRFAVDLNFDPRLPDGGRLVVTVDIASVDMGDGDMNDAVAGEAWFDMAGFATATFTSDDISSSGVGEYVAAGTLELKGVQRDVAVPFTWQDDAERGYMRGELTVQRLDFGIGTGTWTATDDVAADVRVSFAVALRTGD